MPGRNLLLFGVGAPGKKVVKRRGRIGVLIPVREELFLRLPACAEGGEFSPGQLSKSMFCFAEWIGMSSWAAGPKRRGSPFLEKTDERLFCVLRPLESRLEGS